MHFLTISMGWKAKNNTGVFSFLGERVSFFNKKYIFSVSAVLVPWHVGGCGGLPPPAAGLRAEEGQRGLRGGGAQGGGRGKGRIIVF